MGKAQPGQELPVSGKPSRQDWHMASLLFVASMQSPQATGNKKSKSREMSTCKPSLVLQVDNSCRKTDTSQLVITTMVALCVNNRAVLRL